MCWKYYMKMLSKKNIKSRQHWSPVWMMEPEECQTTFKILVQYNKPYSNRSNITMGIQRAGSCLKFIHNHSHYDFKIQTQDQKDPWNWMISKNHKESLLILNWLNCWNINSSTTSNTLDFLRTASVQQARRLFVWISFINHSHCDLNIQVRCRSYELNVV